MYNRTYRLIALAVLLATLSHAVAATGKQNKPAQTKLAQGKQTQTKNARAKPAQDKAGKAGAPTAQAKKSTAPAKSSASTVLLFVASQSESDAFIDPLVIIDDGRYMDPPALGTDEFNELTSKAYRAGQKYHLFFGGAPTGTAVVKKQRPPGDCTGAQATDELQTAARISGLVMGIASTSDAVGRKTASRRFPTPAERAEMSELAHSLYRQKGVTAAALQNMKTINMTAMDLNGDDRAEIVASFSVRTKEKKEAVHALFLIAEPQPGGMRAGLSRYRRTTAADLPGGASLDDVEEYALNEVLVDHLDIDRDGYGEVITVMKGFEGVTYRIYRKQRAQWVQVYEAYNYRCAY